MRLASHSVYREFITGFGLEFFPLGGDPKVSPPGTLSSAGWVHSCHGTSRCRHS